MTGVDFTIDYLDGTKLRINNKPGEVIKPDDIHTVEDKGLPFHKTPYKSGNLFIVFKIKFPDSLTTEKVSQVQTALAA